MIAFRRPSPWAIAVLIVGLAVFVIAGQWQYDKAAYKRARESQWAEARQRAEVDADDVLGRSGGGFDRVRVAGAFMAQRYLLDNQIRDGRAGVDVFAPMTTRAGAILVVALGWLPYADARRVVPPIAPLPDGDVELTGMLAPPPAHGLRLGRGWTGQETNPKLMPYFALDEIAADLGIEIAPRVLRVDAQPASGYRRDWRPVDSMPPARHQAYAWQWWSLAIAIVVVFIVVHRKPKPDA